jgi:dipeptidyl aminopeptidase/acylaminoacyl peptidase
MRFKVEACLGLALAVLLSNATRASIGGPPDAKSSTRPFRMDDLFDEEELRESTFSPDGQAVAFTRRRPASSQPTNTFLIPQTRDDIWVQLAQGEPAKNLTNGAADSSGWWSPRWSPDGRHLSFLSSRGGLTKMWVWERASNKARALTTEGVEFAERPFGDGEPGGCRWVGNHELLCLVMPEGQRATPMTDRGRAVERANAEWANVTRGEVSATVVDSLEFRTTARRMVLIDLQSGRLRPLAIVALTPWSPSIWVAPDNRTVAFVEHDSSHYPAAYNLRMGFPASVGLLCLDGRSMALTRRFPGNVLTTTLAWSPSGRELAFFALDKAVINPVLLYGEEGAKEVRHERPESLETPARLWRVSVEDGRVEQVETGDVDLGRALLPPPFLWMASGELLFRTQQLAQRATPHVEAKAVWSVLDKRGGRTRPLLTQPATSPTALKSIEGGAAFLALMDGHVWRIEPQRGTMRNVTESLGGRVQTLQIADAIGLGMTAVLQVRAASDMAPTSLSDVLLNPSTGHTARLARPDSDAVLESVHASSATAIYKVDHDRGTSLWRGAVSGEQERLAAVNAHRAEIARPERRTIEYKSLNGESSRAYVVLPVGYIAGQRYPLVVDSDIGAELNEQVLKDPMGLILATAGYAYMYADSPVKSMDAIGRNNLLLVTNGILPAVDEAVASGFADRDRVFIYGQSSFGFGVLGVITQTTRFRAAVARYGWSDQISQSLSIGFVRRYSDNPFDTIRIGTTYSYSSLPFWRNGEHYRRNSPLTYVDRVQTPVLMIQGDVDTIPIENAEMFFAALVMQRKVARFIRYAGEGHGTRAPQNRRDEAQRVLAWFDDFGDILRDQTGAMVFEGGRVKSRNGGPPLSPQDFSHIGPTTVSGRGPRASSPQEP